MFLDLYNENHGVMLQFYMDDKVTFKLYGDIIEFVDNSFYGYEINPSECQINNDAVKFWFVLKNDFYCVIYDLLEDEFTIFY